MTVKCFGDFFYIIYMMRLNNFPQSEQEKYKQNESTSKRFET